MTDEVKRFVYANNGWTIPTDKAQKPKTGRLLYNGVEVMNGAFALLNHKRSELLRTGSYRRNLFKITY